MNIGERLLEVRKEKGLSQKAFAQALGREQRRDKQPRERGASARIGHYSGRVRAFRHRAALALTGRRTDAQRTCGCTGWEHARA